MMPSNKEYSLQARKKGSGEGTKIVITECVSAYVNRITFAHKQHKSQARNRLALLIMATLCLTLVISVAMPITAHAQETDQKVVRVGWYESPFNTTDDQGRRSGYAYEYQQKIAAYTGWTYEYVDGSWPELMQMLVDGEIDLMSDVSYTEERAEKMLFSALSILS